MGWIDKIKNLLTKNTKHADMLNGTMPIYSRFGRDVYASDVVQQAMKCIVDEFAKLRPLHVRESGNDVVPASGSIQGMLDHPNDLMTKADFLEKVTYLYLLDLNAWIVPIYNTWTDDDGKTQRKYTAMYPVRPMEVRFIEDPTGTLYVQMMFESGFETTLPYEEVIHWRMNFSVGELMGGNEFGQADYDALLKTLQLNQDVWNGVSRAARATYAVNGIVKYNALMDPNDTPELLKKFERHLLNNQSGILPLDLKSDYTPIKRDVKLIDSETLRFIDEKILRHFGVPLCVLTGDYTKGQYEAFYQKTLEPKIIKLSQAFTKTLFTRRQKVGFDNRIEFYPKDLIFLSTDQTIEMVRLLGDSGGLYENEKRRAFGMQPLAELKGVRMQSLNYADVEIASKYQIQKKKKEDEDYGANV